MNWKERIIVDPKILVGKPVIKGTRLAVEFIVELPAQGWAESEILRNYPGITHEDIAACLMYASKKNLKDHPAFGSWEKENINSTEFQTNIRSEWE
jgi:uncharacterized protein (DUF433 family)